MTNSTIKNEDQAEYTVPPIVTVPPSFEDDVIDRALVILSSRMKTKGVAVNSPRDTENFLKLELAELEQEVFCVLFLDNKHRVISFDKMFYGTIDGASVYPREVVKAALKHNASAVVLAHNHPSGLPEPSTSDKRITTRLQEAMALVDVRVLDHIIIGGTDTISFAERGLI